MAKTISKLSIQLSLSALGVRKGLETVGVSLQGFGQKARTFNEKLSAGFKTTRDRLRSLDKAISPMAKSFLATAGAAVGVSAAIGKVTESVRRLQDQLAFAQRIDISLDRLRVLQWVAERNSASIGTLNTSLQRMTRRIAEAGTLGKGTAVGALAELGLDAERLQQLRPDEQFERIARAMQRMEKRSDQVRIAMALFDTEGVALMSTLDQIANEGLAGVSAKAEEMGIALKGVDTQAIAEADQRMVDLRAQMNASWDTLTANLLPAFEKLLWFLNRIVQSYRAAIDTWKAIWAIVRGPDTTDAWEAQKDLIMGNQTAVQDLVVAEEKLAETTEKTAAAEKKKADALRQTAAARKKIETDLQRFEREEAARLRQSIPRGGAGPTVGALGAGSSAIAFMAQAMSNQKTLENEQRIHRQRIVESNARREAYLAEMNKKLAELNAKEPVVIEETTVVGG